MKSRVFSFVTAFFPSWISRIALRSYGALTLLFFCTSTLAQTPPALPLIKFATFSPAVRTQLKEADAAARQQPRDAQVVGRLGMTLQAYEEHELAALCYQRARYLAPTEFQWAYLLGITHLTHGQYKEAVLHLREAVRLSAAYLPARLKLAEALLSSGEVRASQQLYEALVNQHPAAPQARYGLGRLLASQRATPAALEQLRRACELAPRFGLAHYALALAYRDAGQPELAAEHFAQHRQYQLVRPPLADPVWEAVTALNLSALDQYRKGVALAAEGQLTQAEAAYQQALKVNPALAQAHVNLIVLYGKTRKYEAAEQQYRQANELVPNCAECHYNFGVTLLEQNKKAEAALAFRRSLEINPHYAEALLNYGALLEQKQQYDEALEHYQRAVASQSNLRPAHFQLARMLIYKDRLPEAIAHLQQTLAPEDENTPRYLFALAAAYARAGDRANALKYAREARQRAAALKQTELLAAIERDLKLLEQPQ